MVREAGGREQPRMGADEGGRRARWPDTPAPGPPRRTGVARRHRRSRARAGRAAAGRGGWGRAARPPRARARRSGSCRADGRSGPDRRRPRRRNRGTSGPPRAPRPNRCRCSAEPTTPADWVRSRPTSSQPAAARNGRRRPRSGRCSDAGGDHEVLKGGGERDVVVGLACQGRSGRHRPLGSGGGQVEVNDETTRPGELEQTVIGRPGAGGICRRIGGDKPGRG